jgi:hypothetical protein
MLLRPVYKHGSPVAYWIAGGLVIFWIAIGAGEAGLRFLKNAAGDSISVLTRYTRRNLQDRGQIHTRTERTIIPKTRQQFDTLGHAAFTHRTDRLCFAAA